MSLPIQTDPRRLSALYQYHNAPEVAPAHGLEFDDNLYPNSDKYPVIHERPAYDANYSGKHGFAMDNRPPRIIFGMKVRTFFIVAAAMAIVVIGAAVGGAVGGSNLRSTPTLDGTVSSSISSTPLTSLSSTSTFSAPAPTFSPISDCPVSNNTHYTSSYVSSSLSTNTTSQVFTKFCDLASPLTLFSAHTLAESFVYSFSDCIEVCAGNNAINAGSSSTTSKQCSVAVYQSGGSRPSNCWVGFAGTRLTVGNIQEQQGQDVALLGVL